MPIQSNAAILPDDEDENTGSLDSFADNQPAPEPEPTPEPEAQAPEPPKAEDDIPEALRAKTPAELAKMYLDSQRLIGRQGQELGELRRRADETIKLALERTAPPKPAEPPKPDPVDYFADPEKAIARAIEEHPVVKQLREENERLRGGFEQSKAEQNARRFAELHPDASEIVQDQSFRDWVSKSEIRKKLFLQAHKDYDVAAGDELLSTWKALRAASKPAPAPQAAKTRQDQAAAAAAVPTSGAAGSTKPNSGSGGKKTYRRADILRLMEEDPDRYEALADEIRVAYEEGRVR